MGAIIGGDELRMLQIIDRADNPVLDSEIVGFHKVSAATRTLYDLGMVDKMYLNGVVTYRVTDWGRQQLEAAKEGE